MITDELLEFLRTQHASGTPREDLEKMLIAEGGWEKSDIDQAFRALGIDPPLYVPKRPDPTPEPKPVATDPLPPPQDVPEEPSPAQPLVTDPATARAVQNVEEVAPQILPQDDFLGIFNEEPPRAEVDLDTTPPPVDTPQVQVSAVPETTEGEPIASPEITPAPGTPAVQEIPKESIKMPEPQPDPKMAEPQNIFHPPVLAPQDPNPPAPKIEAYQPKPVETPPPQKRTLQEMLMQVAAPKTQNAPAPQNEKPVQVIGNEDITLDNVEAAAPAPVSSGFNGIHFDLSKIRRAEPPKEPPKEASQETPKEEKKDQQKEATPEPPPLEDVPLEEKKVETRSIAELWLNKQPQPVARAASPKRSVVSDILLRGKGSQVSGIPAVSVPPDSPEQAQFRDTKPKPEEGKPEGKPASAPPAAVMPNTSIAEARKAMATEAIHKEGTKKVVSGLVVGLMALIFIGGGALAFVLLRGPNAGAIFSDVYTQFLSSTSFAYTGSASSDLVLSAANDGVTRNGIVKFDLAYEGQLKNSSLGFGDGEHKVKLKGELDSGNFKWGTDLESDVRIIANSLYFHVLSFPSETGVDPDLFKTYWIKVDLAEIAKELALSGVGSAEGYGNFGSEGKDGTFTALLSKNMPFEGSEKIGDETINGVNTLHLKLKTDPEKMLSLINALYVKYSGKELTLDRDQQLRFKNALAKIDAEVWVEPNTKTLEKFSFDVDLDDDIAGVHVKGKLRFDFTFSGWNAPVSVSAPTPILTLEELQSRMSDYQRVRELRVKDAQKIKALSLVQDALTLYQKDVGRYPTILSELRAKERLPVSSVDDVTLKDFYYAGYVKSGIFTKANKCTAKSKACADYHLGVDLDDQEDPALATDDDQMSDILGDDRAGCANESGKACYDITASARANRGN